MQDLMRVGLSNALAAVALGAAVAALGPVLARRPAVAHALWVLILMKLVTPPLFDVPIGPPAGAERAADAVSFVAVEAAGLDALDRIGADWPEAMLLEPASEPSMASGPTPRPIDAVTASRLLAGAWLAGSLATAALAGVRILRFQRRLRDLSPAGLAVEEEVAALSAAMGLRRPPRVEVIDARVAPMIWGLGRRPRLILPRLLWKVLDARRRSLLLAHELAHLKRRDHWLRFLELATTVLYWWLPLVWWVRRALRDAEERCCDAWVVWMFPDDSRAYAETLLDTVDFLNPGAEPAPLLASGFGKVQHLRRRLTMVMRGATPRTLGWKGSLGALTLAGILLPLGPTWAQKAPEDEANVAATPKDGGDEPKEKTASDSASVVEFHITPRAGVALDGLRKAIEELKGRIRELESKDGKEEGIEERITALKSALKALEGVADMQPGTVVVEDARSRGDFRVQADKIVIGRSRPDDPKVAEARRRVEALRKDVIEKQRAVAEAARRYGEALRDLARLGGGPIDNWSVAPPRLKEGHPFPSPAIAEGRAIIRTPDDSGDKARIDALERKLDRVLQQLEGLKKPAPEGEK